MNLAREILFLELEIELRQEILKEHGSVPKYLHEKFAAAVLGLLNFKFKTYRILSSWFMFMSFENAFLFLLF